MKGSGRFRRFPRLQQLPVNIGEFHDALKTGVVILGGIKLTNWTTSVHIACNVGWEQYVNQVGFLQLDHCVRHVFLTAQNLVTPVKANIQQSLRNQNNFRPVTTPNFSPVEQLRAIVIRHRNSSERSCEYQSTHPSKKELWWTLVAWSTSCLDFSGIKSCPCETR